MRALVIDPYRHEVMATDILPTLEGLRSVVHGPIEFAHQFPNGDILYVNADGQGRFDARFGLGQSNTAPGFGVVVGSVGLDNHIAPAVSSVTEMRSLVRFAVPKITGPSAVRISLGEPTGFGRFDTGPDGGSGIAIGGHVPPNGIMLVCELRDPTRAEINLIQTGLTQFAFERQDNAAILTCRIIRPSDRKQLFFETHFHIGLEDEGTRYLPRRETNDGRTMILLLQDESTVCRTIRMTTIPPHVCDAIEMAVVDQVTEFATDAAFEDKFNASMQRYHARMPTPQIGFAQAHIKG
ncbi:hypothetical protein V1294_006065 [Bradyrhizobium sp. AZCC 1678]|uniref:hypothetical protein n=1 Tax=Bradyrhizobium sp. AZCC 1678 TaxID=3117030 RepID=UPI002FF2979F